LPGGTVRGKALRHAPAPGALWRTGPE
jgi:hypothetical protein